MEVERTAGTSKLMAIVLRKVEVRAGNLKLAPEILLVEVARLFVGVAAGERMPRIGD